MQKESCFNLPLCLFVVARVAWHFFVIAPASCRGPISAGAQSAVEYGNSKMIGAHCSKQLFADQPTALPDLPWSTGSRNRLTFVKVLVPLA